MILLVEVTENELQSVRQKIETNQRMIFKATRENQKDCNALFAKLYTDLLSRELELVMKLKYLKTGNGIQKIGDGNQ